MDFRIVSFSLFLLGLLVAILGSFLPWANRSWTPGEFGGDGKLLGTQTLPGVLTLVGCVTATLFQIPFLARNRRYLLLFVLIGGIVTIAGPAIWIVRPGFPNRPQSLRYGVLYGVYVSLIGGILILTSAVQSLLFAPMMARQLAASKPVARFRLPTT